MYFFYVQVDSCVCLTDCSFHCGNEFCSWKYRSCSRVQYFSENTMNLKSENMIKRED